MNAKNDLREEVINFDPRFALVRLLISLLPPLVGNRLRTNLLRMSGVKIGSGSTVGGMIFVHGGGRPASKISIGQNCWINDSCTFDASAEITIGDNVALGQSVMILTNSHELGPSQSRAGIGGWSTRIDWRWRVDRCPHDGVARCNDWSWGHRCGRFRREPRRRG